MKASQRSQLRALGRSTFESIKTMVADLQSDDPDKADAAEVAIQEDPLSCEVRSDWHAFDDGPGADVEYRILLSTGGPATRIVGELANGEPTSARLEVQDWFLPWTEYADADEEILLGYVRVFYWGA